MLLLRIATKFALSTVDFLEWAPIFWPTMAIMAMRDALVWAYLAIYRSLPIIRRLLGLYSRAHLEEIPSLCNLQRRMPKFLQF